MTQEPRLPISPKPEEYRSEGHVVLPLSETEFKDFITSLLGRPQSISKAFRGAFEVDRDDINDLFSLLHQRITQQNDGLLAKFEATIEFSDNSAVTLKSLEDLLRYNEPRGIVSRALHMTWDYVVRFPDKDGPERQKIQVSFVQGSETLDSDFLLWGPHVYFPEKQGMIAFRIEHTARTWGADIEALLSGFAERMIKTMPPWQKIVKKHTGWVVTAVGALAVALLIIAVVFAINQFDSRQSREAQSLIDTVAVAGEGELTSALSEVVLASMSPDWPLFFAKLLAVVLGVIVVGAVLLIWLGMILDRELPGFVLLTKSSERLRDSYLRRERARIVWFSLATVANIGNGLFANVLFDRFVS